MSDTVRINVWSGPRNVSTALMYAFRQRRDTTVVDEPLYGHYLRVTGVEHPARDLILAAMETDGATVVQDQLLGPWPTPVAMFKQMAHHLVDLDRSWLDRCRNVLLIRDPREVLLSYAQQVERPTVDGLGYPIQVELLERGLAGGEPPLVVDAKALLLDPAGQLRRLCEHCGIGYDEAMLSWPAGPKPEDGVWAPHWYARLHTTTRFAPYEPRDAVLPDRLGPIHAATRPLYERLLAHAT